MKKKLFFVWFYLRLSDSHWNRELNGLKNCLIQQISCEASSHAISEGFSRNFGGLHVKNRNFRELANCHASKSFFTGSDSVEICDPVMAVAVEGPIPGEHVGCSQSKAEWGDDFDHIIFCFFEVVDDHRGLIYFNGDGLNFPLWSL